MHGQCAVRSGSLETADAASPEQVHTEPDHDVRCAPRGRTASDLGGDNACDECLMTLPTAATHGPMIANAAQEVLAVNFGGCYANLDGDSSDGGCGPNINHSNQCLKVECSECSDYTTHGPLTLACIEEARLAGNPCEGTALRDECKAQTNDAGFQDCNSSTSLMRLWCGP